MHNFLEACMESLAAVWMRLRFQPVGTTSYTHDLCMPSNSRAEWVVN